MDRVGDLKWFRQKFLTRVDWHLDFISLALVRMGRLVGLGENLYYIFVMVDILS